MRYQLILFDLDGTLVDSLPDIAGALNHALRVSALTPLDLGVVRTLVGDGVHRLAERALAVAGASHVDADTLVTAIKAYYLRHAAVATTPYPGLVDMLAALRRDRRRHLAVLTNKPGDIARQLLTELALDGHFDAVIGDHDGFPRKPDPTAARSLLERFSVPVERTLVVGDGLPDMAVARALGCASAAAGWGYTDREALTAEAPTYLLGAPGELMSIV